MWAQNHQGETIRFNDILGFAAQRRAISEERSISPRSTSASSHFAVMLLWESDRALDDLKIVVWRQIFLSLALPLVFFRTADSLNHVYFLINCCLKEGWLRRKHWWKRKTARTEGKDSLRCNYIHIRKTALLKLSYSPVFKRTWCYKWRAHEISCIKRSFTSFARITS